MRTLMFGMFDPMAGKQRRAEVACGSHNPEVAGSSPAVATKLT